MAFALKGGAYVVSLMDRYAAGYSILFAVFFESLVVSWAYGKPLGVTCMYSQSYNSGTSKYSL